MARKTIQLRPSKRQQPSREVATMIKLKHPHVVRVIMSYRDATSLTILMQPVADYNLSQYLQSSTDPFDEKISRLWIWCNCLAVGLQYMHEEIGIRHLDIKPSNILVKDRKVFYADFGSSNAVADDESVSENMDYTELYAAPELREGKRGRASDIFSLGCVFLEMATVPLRRSMEELRQLQQEYIQTGARGLHWATIWARKLRGLVSQASASSKITTILDTCDAMMKPRPDERLSAADILTKIGQQPCCDYDHRRLPKVSQKSHSWPSAMTAKGRVAILPPTVDNRQDSVTEEFYDDYYRGTSVAHACDSSQQSPSTLALRRKPPCQSQGHMTHKPPPNPPKPQHSLYPWQPNQWRLQRFIQSTDTYQELLGSGRSSLLAKKNAVKRYHHNKGSGFSAAAAGLMDLLDTM